MPTADLSHCAALWAINFNETKLYMASETKQESSTTGKAFIDRRQGQSFAHGAVGAREQRRQD